MTEEFRSWWIVFFNSLVLILLAIIDVLSRPIRLLLWILSFGLSSIVLKHIDKFLPEIDFTTDFSPRDPLIAFYYRDPWLAIDVNTYFLDSFSVTLSKERYLGNHIWQRWAWAKSQSLLPNNSNKSPEKK